MNTQVEENIQEPKTKKTKDIKKDKLGIYQRLQKVRRTINAMNLKKSGKNPQGFSYYELADFEPFATVLYEENDLCPIYTTENVEIWEKDTNGMSKTAFKELAVLRIFGYEDENPIVFKIETANNEIWSKAKHWDTALNKYVYNNPTEWELTKSNPIQNLGAKITYTRRYLGMLALDLVESDFVDSYYNEDDLKPQATTLTDVVVETKQEKAVAKGRGKAKAKTVEQTAQMSPEQYGQMATQVNESKIEPLIEASVEATDSEIELMDDQTKVDIGNMVIAKGYNDVGGVMTKICNDLGYYDLNYIPMSAKEIIIENINKL